MQYVSLWIKCRKKLEILIEERKKYNHNFQWPILDIEFPNHGRRQFVNRYAILHGRHEEQTENIRLSKLQRKVEDKRKTIMKEKQSHVNELDNKIDKKVEKLAGNNFQVTK